jgi:hypothetical protein
MRNLLAQKRNLLIFTVNLFFISLISPEWARCETYPVDFSSNKVSHTGEKDEFVGTYIIAIPTAGTRDFISNASFLGFGLDWGHYLHPQVSLGLSLRWQRFYQEDDRATYEADNATITGKQYKAFNNLPIFPRIKYDFSVGPDSSIVPYIQLGLGPMYGQRYREVGAYTGNNFGWQFGFGPEIGIYWRAIYGKTGALFSVRYDAGLGTDAIPAFSAFNFSIGFRQSI